MRPRTTFFHKLTDAFFFDAFFINSYVYREAKKVIKKYDDSWKGSLTDEKAIAPNLSNEEVLNFLSFLNQIFFIFNYIVL